MMRFQCYVIACSIFCIWIGLSIELYGRPIPLDSSDAGADKVESPTIVLTYGNFGNTFSFANLGAELTVYRFAKENPLYMHTIRVSAGFGDKLVSHGFVPVLVRGVLVDDNKHVEIGVGCNIVWREYIHNPELNQMFETQKMGYSPVSPLVCFSFRSEPRDGGFVFRYTNTIMYNVADNRLWTIFGLEIGIAF